VIVYPKSSDENMGLRRWIENLLPDYKSGPFTLCVGVEREQKLCAVVAWDHWTGFDIEVSIAASSPRWATRQTIATLMAYPFLQLKCQRMTAKVYKSNRRSRKFVEGIGFRHEGTHRHAGRNFETIFTFGLTRAEYMERYLRGSSISGKDTPARAAACA
jgi:RimJ/RimL family protein N-acetyltransferase